MRTVTWMLVALMGLLFVRPAPAEDTPAEPAKKEKKNAEKPAGPQFDEGAGKLFEAWERMQYHLGRAGVKKASYKIKAAATIAGQTREGTAVYEYDGKKGKLEWDNPQLGAMFSRQGWSAKNMDDNFDKEAMRRSLGNAKIILKSEETRDVLLVDGKNNANVTSFVFNKEGVMTTWVMEVPDGAGTQKLDFNMTYGKFDGKYVMTGWNFKFNTPMGPFEETTKLTFEKIGKYYVLTKVESKNTMGTKLLDFTDWKFNDDVGTKKEAPEKKKETAGQ